MEARKPSYRRAWRRACEHAARVAIQPMPPAEVERVCASVVRLPRKYLRDWLRRSEHANHRDVVTALVKRSYSLRFTDARVGLRYAEAAVEVAAALRLGAPFAELEADLRAEAWANLGNYLRIRDRFEEAAHAFSNAETQLELGTLDPILRADFLAKKSVLLSEQGDFKSALAEAGEAVRLLDLCNEQHHAARARVHLSDLSYLNDEPEPALGYLLLAVDDLDYEGEPEVGFALVHNTLLSLAAAGQTAQALAGCRAARALYEAIAPPLLQIRGMWLRGRLLLDSGFLAEAEVELEAARAGFLTHERELAAAVVTLELALAFSLQGKASRVAELAQQMYPAFLSQRIPEKAAAVLLLFGDAAKADRAGREEIMRWLATLVPLWRAYEKGAKSPQSPSLTLSGDL